MVNCNTEKVRNDVGGRGGGDRVQDTREKVLEDRHTR